ncbi:putative UDP-rhamnose:rhamnosyltransferase 1 [Phoenix dactylifera]|uniref:UDP-rhamnose:rhamnosyltransferase 1 n=1 Tax=Phoenix dactylifera TaxID=42345 RepID=A0A8B7BKL8_PHODC|nr:putative UDP-rhamnose:rhamnosyltransferase 1 [Phoenix dactylifera]
MDNNGALRIAVFPWLAFGHMLPFLQLSKSLAMRGHRISFLATPRNIQRLPKIPPHLAPLIDFASMPLPKVEGLPENAEATPDLPKDQVQYLKVAFDRLGGALESFLDEASPKPDWIILDFACHWVPKLASMFGVPCAFFSVFAAPFLAFWRPSESISRGGDNVLEELTAPPKGISFETSVAFRLHEARRVIRGYVNNASGVCDADRLLLTVEGCKVVAPRSCWELHSDWLCYLQELYGKPVIPVGLLPPATDDGGAGVDATSRESNNALRWLDKQAPGSVVYAAFGSETVLSTEMLHELAFGLELSQVPFLWVIRKPVDIADEGREILPEGFEDRTRDRGVIAMGWIDQLEVLAHASVGGCLTHSGWSSVIESLQLGHPLIMLPFIVDQGIIARVMEERRIGIEVPRNEEDGSFNREELAKAIRLVMVEEEGNQFRSKARDLKEIFADKDYHERYVDEFILCLRNQKED